MVFLPPPKKKLIAGLTFFGRLVMITAIFLGGIGGVPLDSLTNKLQLVPLIETDSCGNRKLGKKVPSRERSHIPPREQENNQLKSADW